MEMTELEAWQTGMNALITGATTGIGYEISKFFAADEYNLILVARDEELLSRRKEELEADFGILVRIFAMDLTEEAAPRRLFSALQEQNIPVEMLVNNAGYGMMGKFWDIDSDAELNMIQLNVVALTALTRLFLREMVRRGSGRILNVASTAAFQPGPLMAVYYASKAYVLSLSEALANETKNSGVTVSVLCPGPTSTQFQKRAGQEGARLLKFKSMGAYTVARAGYRGMRKGKAVIIPGLMNKISVWFARVLPHGLLMNIIRYLHQKG